MIGRKGVAARLAVAVFLALASGALAQKSPTPPPGEPGVQPCLVRNGITICDPALIELILRYNLEVLPAFPPGVIPIVVETLAELEALLSAFLGAVAVVGGEGDPIAGPHDPGTALGEICIMRWDSELGGFVCVAYPAPPPTPAPPSPPGGGSGSGCATCPPLREAHVLLKHCSCSAAVAIPWWLCPTPCICFEVDAWYHPGVKFTRILGGRVYKSGPGSLIYAGYDFHAWEPVVLVLEEGRRVFVRAGGEMNFWVGLKLGESTLGATVPWAHSFVRVFEVPTR